MNINLHNYEEFFLLYADNELSADEKLAVDQFVEAHPDLKAELQMIQQTILPAGNDVVFNDKESLFRTTDTDSLVNLTNYEGFFVQYSDDELSNEEKAATELFVYKYPECQEEFELIQKTRLEPDTNIQFPDKNLLYRSTQKTRPVIAIWIRYAAAAIILLLAGLFWLQREQPVTPSASQPIALQHPAPAVKDPVPQALVADNQPATAASDPQKVKPAETHTKTALPIAKEKLETPAIAPQELLASQNEQSIKPSDVKTLASNDLPKEKIEIPIVKETTGKTETIFSSQAAKEDYIYVANEPTTTKKPLRGLLRRASRFVEQNNPLTSDHKKGGVFTASNEQ